jgi:hypothetical protein
VGATPSGHSPTDWEICIATASRKTGIRLVRLRGQIPASEAASLSQIILDFESKQTSDWFRSQDVSQQTNKTD